jgi:hypothetical protein
MELYKKGIQPGNRTFPRFHPAPRLSQLAVICVTLFFAGLPAPALAAVEDNRVLALDPIAGRVVVKTPDGSLEVIGVGEAFPGSRVVVVQVLTDKVIGEEVVGEETRVRQQVWVYKANPGDSVSRVERLLLEVPATDTLQTDGSRLIYTTGEAAGQAAEQ